MALPFYIVRNAIMAAYAQLTDAQRERLEMLAEEASEVVQAVMKVLRHGYSAFNPHSPDSGTNEDQLNREINDFLTVRNRMIDEGDIKQAIPAMSTIWRQKLPYTHHQG